MVSCEMLNTRLGIDRETVRKHIQALIAAGIPIVSSPTGYRIAHDPDSLLPWEFGHWQERIYFLAETTSTMDQAMVLAREGCPDFSVVVAQRQTCGRGRMQRTWLSADGGLYFSIIVRPDIPMMIAGLVNLAAAIDMADLLRGLYRIDARLKWPNDILVDNRKICGILSQMEVAADRVDYINIGIGLNVNNDPETEAPIAVSLKSLIGRAVPRRELLMAFLDAFKQRVQNLNPETVIAQWKARNVTLGQKVRVFTVKEMVEGVAVNIDAHGGLILRLADGTCQTVVYGDCFHR